MGTSREVDVWFERYENPMKEVVLRMRAIVLGADARMEETIKWQAPTFSYRGNLASFFPRSKQHASLMFHRGAEIPGRHPRLEGSGGTSRVMKIGSLAEAEAARRDLEQIVRAWCDWRDASSEEESGSSVRAGVAKAAAKKKAVKKKPAKKKVTGKKASKKKSAPKKARPARKRGSAAPKKKRRGK